MRHYEIVFLVHPDQGNQVPAMIERYRNMVASSGGAVHRTEDWGRRSLAYPIKKIHKANYVLINIECNAETLNQLTDNFRFNDAVIRDLVICRDAALTEPSLLAKTEEDDASDNESAAQPDKEVPMASPTQENTQQADDSRAGAEKEIVADGAAEPTSTEQ